MKLYPPHFLLISVIAMLAIWYVFSPSNPKNIFLMSTGWVLIVSGLTCNVIAANQFMKANTSIIPLTESSFLVKKGRRAGRGEGKRSGRGEEGAKRTEEGEGTKARRREARGREKRISSKNSNSEKIWEEA